MKHFLLKLIILLSLVFINMEMFSQSGWNTVYNNNTQNYCIQFKDASSGWVAGANGISQTYDGGASWYSRLNSRITSVKFVTYFRGYATGYDQKIYFTSNGGFTWTSQYTGSFNLELNSIDYVAGGGTFFAVGDSGIMVKTSNNGNNWYPSYIGTPEELRTVYFVDGVTGWIGSSSTDSNSGHIYKTTNSGQNWFIQNNASQKGIWSFSFINSYTGWAAALRGVILKTTNGGDTWVILLNSNFNFYTIFFADINHGWVAGSSPNEANNIDTAIINYTSNGGINWTNQYTGESGVDNIVHSLSFIDTSTGWAALSDGKILKTTTGGNPIGIRPGDPRIPSKYFLSQNYPNPFNPVTKIKFAIPLSGGVSAGRGGLVKLIIFDVLGREVAVLVNESLSPGTYEAEWDGTNYPSGVYFYKLIASEFTETRKMVLVK
jgi:photosystem II stability/assembly factor-like uncharacterized protein